MPTHPSDLDVCVTPLLFTPLPFKCSLVKPLAKSNALAAKPRRGIPASALVATSEPRSTKIATSSTFAC